MSEREGNPFNAAVLSLSLVVATILWLSGYLVHFLKTPGWFPHPPGEWWGEVFYPLFVYLHVLGGLATGLSYWAIVDPKHTVGRIGTALIAGLLLITNSGGPFTNSFLAQALDLGGKELITAPVAVGLTIFLIHFTVAVVVGSIVRWLTREGGDAEEPWCQFSILDILWLITCIACTFTIFIAAPKGSRDTAADVITTLTWHQTAQILATTALINLAALLTFVPERIWVSSSVAIVLSSLAALGAVLAGNGLGDGMHWVFRIGTALVQFALAYSLALFIKACLGRRVIPSFS